MTSQSLSYPETLAVECDDGYTTDGSAGGTKGFQIQCSATGTLEGRESCLAVSCGEPTATEATTAGSGKVTFGSAAGTWTCKPGYSVDGMPDGATTFDRLCEADGTFSMLGYVDCVDINYCVGGTRC